MKKILFVILILALGICCYASKFIEADDESLIFVTSVDSKEMGKGTFANLRPKGLSCGLIQKYSKDMTQSVNSTFGGSAGEVSFFDVVKDKNGDFVVLGVATEEAFGAGDLKNRKSYGGNDIIFVRYGRDLKVKDVQNFGCDADDFAEKIILDKKNKFVIVGRTSYSVGPKTNALIASFNDKFELDTITEFKGSFVDEGDAEFTEFSNIIEGKESGYVVLGNTVNNYGDDHIEKAMVLKYSDKLALLGKKSFGSKESVVHLTDIVEQSESGYIAVGFCEENVQKGYVLELTPGLNKLSAFTFMPVGGSQKALYNGLYSIEPYKEDDAYIVTGVAVFKVGESTNYYTLFEPDKGFTEVVYFPKMGGLNHLVDSDKSLYIVGYDNDNYLKAGLLKK